MTGVAHYDGFAEWYDTEFRRAGMLEAEHEALERLLGRGRGRCLDVGCGTGAAMALLGELGWEVTGIDVSEDQLRLARARGADVVAGRAEELPFADDSFDAAVSLWTHTDVDDFPAAAREVTRVLRPGSPFVYVGAHPCFVGPHSRFLAGEGVPELHPGYRTTGRYTEGPGVRPDGLRARVGASHLPLGLLLQAFLGAGLELERFEEPAGREYPYRVAMRWRR